MSENIQARLYVKFILKVLVFGVLRPIRQVYDDIRRGSSIAMVGNMYDGRWIID